MSMQTGSTRGHHLANYHCWHIGADLNCHHKHITPCPNCPAICHHATRRAIQYGEDGATGDSPMTKPPGQQCRQDRLPGHLLSSVLEDTQWTLNVSCPSQCPVWLTGVYCVFDIYFLRERKKKNMEDQSAANKRRGMLGITLNNSEQCIGQIAEKHEQQSQSNMLHWRWKMA